MDLVLLIGRILFVPVFLASAMGHLRMADMLAGYAASKKIPSPKNAVIGTGIMLLVGGLSILLGIYADLGALLIVVFLVPTAFLMHAFWKETDPMAQANERTQFLKDLSLAGGALFVYVLAHHGAIGATITGPLF